MPDQITDEEQAAIAQAVAAGRVTKIETYHEKRKVKMPVGERRELIRRRLEEGATGQVIADEIGCSLATVQMDKKAMGLVKAYGMGGRKTDEASLKREHRATKGAKKVTDRRRFKVQPVPMGEAARVAPADLHRTVFTDRVFKADGSELVLKDGANNAKIGGDVLVGWLKGAYIVTLSLEERATCPRSCGLYRECYGNVMPHARRWEPGPELEAQIREEIAMACAKNDRVLVRLHVLGDFYSVEYLQMWAELLDLHDNLFVFGFTAWKEDSQIGNGIRWLREQAPRRFMVRTSDRTGIWGSFTLPFPTEAKTIGDAIVCPEQRDAMLGTKRGTHCGNCGACWSTDKPIAFILH